MKLDYPSHWFEICRDLSVIAAARVPMQDRGRRNKGWRERIAILDALAAYYFCRQPSFRPSTCTRKWLVADGRIHEKTKLSLSSATQVEREVAAVLPHSCFDKLSFVYDTCEIFASGGRSTYVIDYIYTAGRRVWLPWLAFRQAVVRHLVGSIGEFCSLRARFGSHRAPP